MSRLVEKLMVSVKPELRTAIEHALEEEETFSAFLRKAIRTELAKRNKPYTNPPKKQSTSISYPPLRDPVVMDSPNPFAPTSEPEMFEETEEETNEITKALNTAYTVPEEKPTAQEMQRLGEEIFGAPFKPVRLSKLAKQIAESDAIKAERAAAQQKPEDDFPNG